MPGCFVVSFSLGFVCLACLSCSVFKKFQAYGVSQVLSGCGLPFKCHVVYIVVDNTFWILIGFVSSV